MLTPAPYRAAARILRGGLVQSPFVEHSDPDGVCKPKWRRWAWPFCAAIVLWAGPSRAERIENTVAVFSALDKVTARISKFEVEINKTALFGSIKVTPRACYSRPPTELPKTTTFVEVDEVQLDGKEKRIFTGWMLAESPGIFGVEHPTVDVWLTECHKPLGATAQTAPEAVGKAAAGEAPAGTAATPSGEAGQPAAAEPQRRRARR